MAGIAPGFLRFVVLLLAVDGSPVQLTKEALAHLQRSRPKQTRGHKQESPSSYISSLPKPMTKPSKPTTPAKSEGSTKHSKSTETIKFSKPPDVADRTHPKKDSNFPERFNE